MSSSSSWTRRHKLGQGSTAVVYLATPHNSGEPFAVKSAEFSRSEFLQREQRILSSVASPYVVKYRGWEITTEEDGRVMYNLMMDYMPSGTIVDEICRRRGRRMDEREIGLYTWQVLKGLEYLRSKGIVHCDVKGSNILVGPNGAARLADFGCSKRVGSVGEPTRGTPMFMAPEAASGEEQGHASDVWGLGCTVIEMATGGRSVWGEEIAGIDDPISAMYRVGYSGRLPEFPDRMSEVGRDFLEKCLRRDQKERWTASQLLDHPFVSKFEPYDSCCFASPTSVLDRVFWNSIEETDGLGSEKTIASPCCSPSEANEEEEGRWRIERLAMGLVKPIWNDDDDDDCGRWITVRGHLLEESLDSDCCVISNRIRGSISFEGVGCSLPLEQDHDVRTLLPSLQIIVSQA